MKYIYIFLFSLVGWQWGLVKNNLAIIVFILISGLAKLGFHRLPALSSRVPESCLLVLLGLSFGGRAADKCFRRFNNYREGPRPLSETSLDSLRLLLDNTYHHFHI